MRYTRRWMLPLALGLVALLLAAACNPTQQSTAPTETPRMADQQVVAMVRDWLSNRSYQLVVKEGAEVLLDEEATCLNLYRQLTDWTAEYLGNGAWMVSVSTGDYQWIVNERSEAVQPLRGVLFAC